MSSVESSSDLSQSQEVAVDTGKINEIQHYIENLDDRESRNKFSEELTKSVIDALSKIPPETKSKLADSFKNVYEKNKNDPDFQKLTVQITKLAESFGLNIDGTSVVADTTSDQQTDTTSDQQTDTTSDQQTDTTSEAIGVILPEFPLEGVLEGIEEGEDGKRTNVTYSQLMRNKPELQDGQEDKTPEGKRLYDTIDGIESQLTTINEFLQNDKLKENESIKGLGEILKNIQNALNNTTVVNVRKLQDFIFNNLDGDSYQEEFKSKNHRREGRGFDGQFGESSLKGLDIVLGKTKNYLDGVSDKLKESEDQEDVQKLNAIKANPDVNYVQGSGDADLNSWLTDLPDGATVDFKDDNEKAKLNALGEQTILLKILFNGHEKEIQVTVNVTDGSSPEQASDGSVEQDMKQQETQPLSVDGKQYLPMENKPSFYPEGAVFYSSVAVPETSPSENEGDSQTPDNQPRFATESNEVDGDGIYFMKVGDNTYEVKIDNLGNLCPVARNIDSGKPVIFEGNDSGKKYLANKLPQMSGENAGSIYFDWNGKDYVMGIRGYDKTITVEPMTIAGLWLKGNDGEKGATVSESLAFLNLTNYLRNVGKYKDVEFRNDNPDLKMIGSELYVRVNRRRNVSLDDNGNPVKNGKWLHINKEEFGLTSDTGLMKRFIKYNNHEDRNDNWDTKTPNKYYATVQL